MRRRVRPVGRLLGMAMMVHAVRAQRATFNGAPSASAKAQCMATYDTFKEEHAECAFLWSTGHSTPDTVPSPVDCSAQYEHFSRTEGGHYAKEHLIAEAFHRAFPGCDRSAHSCMARKATARAVYDAVHTARAGWCADDVLDDAFEHVFEDAFPDCAKACDSARWHASQFTEQPIVVASIHTAFPRSANRNGASFNYLLLV